MSEEMEKQPAQATSAPFRRRRGSRRRGGRRNDSERNLGSFSDASGGENRGAEMLEEDPSGRLVATDESGESRITEDQRESSEAGGQNGDQIGRAHV